MRVALHSVIREGAVDDYVERHARIPADLVETFERIGIHEWTSFRSVRRPVHVAECVYWDSDPVSARRP